MRQYEQSQEPQKEGERERFSWSSSNALVSSIPMFTGVNIDNVPTLEVANHKRPTHVWA